LKRKLVTIGLILISVLLISTMALSACSKPAESETITLKGVLAFAPDDPSSHFALVLSDLVKLRSGGRLNLEILGASEVIKAGDQAEAVRTGAIDFAVTPTSYYRSLVPAVTGMINSQYTALEERETGFYDYLVDAHEEVNIYYLGRACNSQTFFVFTNKMVNTPQELAGQQMRSSGTYDNFLASLGVVPVRMSHSEKYSALERGVIDGTAGPVAVAVSLKEYEVLDYWVNHAFYRAGATAMIFNLDTWNGLPDDMKDLLNDIQLEIESQLDDYFTSVDSRDVQVLIAGGMEPIEFSEADAAWYLEQANKGIWQQVTDSLPADQAQTVLKFLQKQ